MRKLEHGLEKVYLHLDGMAMRPDNQHPDYLPACEEAGGMGKECDHCRKCTKEMNYTFAIHDQYRDYYFDAKTYDPEFSTNLRKGKWNFRRWGQEDGIHLCKPIPTLLEKKLYRTFSSRNSAGRQRISMLLLNNEPDECASMAYNDTKRMSGIPEKMF